MEILTHDYGRMMQPMRTIFVSICLAFFGGCATSQPKLHASEHWALTFPWKPKLGHQADGPDGYAIYEFTREEEDINNWQELVTVQNFSKTWGGPSPEDALNSLMEVREKECPGQTKWNIIEKDENSIAYEWQAKPCLGWPDQHEIAKVIDGQYNRFRIAYTAKTYQLSPERRNEWINIILESKVVKD